jgi:hypothetical protein
MQTLLLPDGCPIGSGCLSGRAWVCFPTHGLGHGQRFLPIYYSGMGLGKVDPVKPDPIARIRPKPSNRKRNLRTPTENRQRGERQQLPDRTPLPPPAHAQISVSFLPLPESRASGPPLDREAWRPTPSSRTPPCSASRCIPVLSPCSRGVLHRGSLPCTISGFRWPGEIPLWFCVSAGRVWHVHVVRVDVSELYLEL